jgi:hypothetical protein
MEKDIVDGPIGKIGAYDLEFKGGALCLKLTSEVGVSIEVSVGADMVLDAIAKAIPGQVDDAVIQLIKGALKM